MEVFIVILFLSVILLLGFGYIVMNAARNSLATSQLSGEGRRSQAMAERYMLQASLAQSSIARQNKKLQKLAKDLDLSAQELVRLNDMKSKFLSMVVHDVRSPLASIRGFSQILARKMPGEKERLQFENIVNSAEQLNRLISDLTDLAMIEAGKLSVTPVPFDLRVIAQEVLPGVQIRAAETNLQLLYAEAAEPVMVNGDKFRLGQVLMNLATNAFKFTPAGGTVQVTIAREGAKAVVSVKDSGIGIHPSETKKIFERFYQARHQKDANLRKKGWGLGLSIAAEIIRAHKGEIAASSPGLGKGSTFYYKLPALHQ